MFRSNALRSRGGFGQNRIVGPIDGPFVAYRAPNPPSFYTTLLYLGLATNLQLCLDDGVSSSQFPSGTTFPPLDQSGSASAFAQAWLATPASQPSWANPVHQANAIWSVVTFVYQGTASIYGFIGDDGTTSTGFEWYCAATSRKPTAYVGNGASAVLLEATTQGDTGLNTSAWNMVGITVNSVTGVGGGFNYLNGVYNQVGGSDTWDATYSSPSAGAAAQIIQVGGNGNNTRPVSLGSRISCMAMWSGTAITKAQMDLIWTAMRGRYGL